MRKVLIVAAVLAGCSDSPGWSRDELPARARIDVALTGTSADTCALWASNSAFVSIEAGALDTDAPTIKVGVMPESCAWASDSQLGCSLEHGPVGSLLIDFDRSIASQVFAYTDGGGAALTCMIDYQITAVVALP